MTECVVNEECLGREGLLYLALFGGNIFAIYATEDDPGQLIYLYTVNESLSDAQWHTILLNFTGKFAILQVNDHATVSSRKEYAVPTIRLAQEGLFAFVGGGSADIIRVIGSDHRFPGTESFKGDIREIKINSKFVDYYKPSILMSARSISSAGVSPPPTQAAPLPIVSLLPHTSSCSPLDLLIDPAGVQMGLNYESFLQYHVDATLQRHLLSSFIISMKFRTHAADGILCFVADSLTDPRAYVALYLVDGYIEFKVSTEKADAQTFTVLSIITKFRYNNGQWWEILVLRINDFLAIVNTERRDYTNNKASSSRVTYIRLQGSQITPFYVGGVPRNLFQQLQGCQLPSGFQGCIQKLEISANQDIPAVNFLLLTSEVAVGTGPCFTAVTEGAFFQGHGYIHLGKFAANDVTISLSIKTHQRSGLLLQLLEPSSDKELSVGFQEGQIAVSMSYNLSPLPEIKFSLLNPYRICDNKPHSIEVRLLENVGLEIRVDTSILLASPMPAAFFKEIMDMDVYFGGAPGQHSPAKSRGFTGCILSMFINGKETSFLSGSLERINVSRGCPS
ncbi:usherin-like [Callorhinchus milii]|uniref:usherin-like n=1 Tax=Callorhinchus milii TaxID=7868 RepID=UPI001C3F7234|nr:usherin-like [Callorhinchus milii]